MRIVVTGSSGFIAGHLVNHLKARNLKTVPVSRKEMGFESYRETPEGDILVHLAENNNRRDVNLLGEPYFNEQLEVARSLAEKKYSHMIYISSMAVYNQGESAGKSENDPVGKDDLYAKTKANIENIFLNTGRATVFRLSNVYGEGMSGKTVQSRIIEQLKVGNSVKLWTMDPKRDWIAVEDVCDAIIGMISHGPQGVLNLGSGEGKSVRELANIIAKVMNKENVELIEERPGFDNSESFLVIDKLKKIIGEFPSISLEEGYRKLIGK